MSTSSYDSFFGMASGHFDLAVGVTNAIPLLLNESAGVNYVQLSRRSGGSFLIFGCAEGASMTAAEINTAFGEGEFYLVGSSQIIEWRGAAPRLYAASIGATTVIQYMAGFSPGNGV